MDLADEVFDHFLSNVEIRDHTIAHRADGLNGARGTTQHQFRIFAKGQSLFHTIFDLVCNNRRFIQHDTFATHINKRVRGTEVDRHISGKKAAKSQGHTCWLLLHSLEGAPRLETPKPARI